MSRGSPHRRHSRVVADRFETADRLESRSGITVIVDGIRGFQIGGYTEGIPPIQISRQ